MRFVQSSHQDDDARTVPVLQLRNVSKVYGPVRAVDRLSIEVRAGEVLTLLGPSGCGKSTTMRLIMGLERCDEGEIIYQGNVVDSAAAGTHLPVHKRNMGMVFQSYAIWPHMTVFENVAYPLRLRRIDSATIRDSVSRVLEQVGLTGFEDRPSPNLSGGQQQRVALARSLVFEPKLLLLDEPFSNLDARLREQMRTELRVLQRRLGITVVFVTHDQIEALSLSDRIAVMSAGRVEQVGAPIELYNRPGTPAVRDFLGRTVTLRGLAKRRTADGGVEVDIGGGRVMLAAGAGTAAELAVQTPCSIAIRPEKLNITPIKDDGGRLPENAIRGTIEVLLFVGDRYEATIALPDNDSIQVYLSPDAGWCEGQNVSLKFPPPDVQLWLN